MKLKLACAGVALAFLTACSSGPSEKDVQSAFLEQMELSDAAMSGLIGQKSSDLFKLETDVLNKTKKAGDIWEVEILSSISPKIDPATANFMQKTYLNGAGIHQKNDVVKKKVTLIFAKEGDKWTIVDAR